MEKLKLTGNSPAVRNRQRTEQTIALAVVDALLDAGYSLGVYDGEEVVVHHTKDLDKIFDALFNTDEDYLYVYTPQRRADEVDYRPDFWVRFVYGNDGWDVICDYSNVLDIYIGDGTAVEKLIDYVCEHGTVIGFKKD